MPRKVRTRLADIALMDDQLAKLPAAITLARKATGIIRQNIGLSLPSLPRPRQAAARRCAGQAGYCSGSITTVPPVGWVKSPTVVPSV